MIVDETVGHHTANLIGLLWVLTDGKASNRLLARAALHDTAEAFTGDVPAPAKWHDPELAARLALLEADHLERAGVFLPVVSEDELLLLKAADMLDLIFKCREELSMGNETVVNLLNNGIDYIDMLPLQGAVKARIKELLDDDKLRWSVWNPRIREKTGGS